ncbi:MAG: TlpA family protein disulfide reductase [Anaerolineae bacterium]|nr:TlpA family protein disulfide reductase [Anaerolineae bacterium]
MTESVAQAPQKRRTVSFLIFGIIGAFIIGLLVVLAIAVRTRGAPPLESGAAPDFTVTTFEGETYSLADLKGRPVVLNFWASWCIPCRDEAPALQRAWETYKDRGVMVLGVDYVDTESDAKKFIAEFRQTYPNAPDLGTRISQAFRISGVPETYFIDREGKMLQGIDENGRVKANWIGPLPEEVLIARIEELLKQ